MNGILIILLIFIVCLAVSVVFYFIKKHWKRETDKVTNFSDPKGLQNLDDAAKRLIRRDMEPSQIRKQQEQQIKELDKTAKMLVRRDLELTGANEKLRELDRIKSEFISIAAHQLRTPLGSMRWNIERLLSRKDMPKDIKERIEHVYDRSKHMASLVNDLLTVSRIEQGRVSQKLKTTEICDVVRAIVSETKAWTKEKGVSIELKIEEDKIPPAMIDAQHFREAMENLLSNAVKYNRLNGKVTVELKPVDSEHAQISIADTGIGIPQEDKSRLFSKFFRAGNALQSNVEGSGLGLFIAKYYVEGCGGKLSFQSEEGKGTTFYIDLPLRLSPNGRTSN